MKTNFASSFKLLLGITLYRLILDLSYILVISKLSSYEGYYLTINNFKLLESYLFLVFLSILIATFTSSRVKIFSSEYLLFLLFLFTYVPLGSLYALSDRSRVFFYYCTIFWFLFIVFYFNIPVFKLKSLQIPKYTFIICAYGINLITLFLIYRYLGISLNFNLSLVYDIRSKYIEARIPFAGYLFNWTGYVINPLLLSYSFDGKQWSTFMSSLFVQLLLFSQTGLKSFLFLPFLVLGVNWLYRRYGKNMLYILTVLMMSFVIILGILFYNLVGDVWSSSLFTRRALYIPALLSFYYYDFFSSRGPIYLSQHRLFGNLLTYPYSLDPPHLIGSVYFGSAEISANNGILGDSYMNFGFAGSILWSFVLVLLLKILDSFVGVDRSRLVLGVTVVFTNVFTNSALLTNLTTHGFLLLILFSVIMPKIETKGRSRND